MSYAELTHTQAMAVAKAVHTLRPDWDTPGIEDALGRARHLAPAGDLAIAAIRAAGLASNRTPAIIALEGPHWRGSDVKPQIRFDPAGTCAVCSQSEHVCRGRWADDHAFRAIDRNHSIASLPVPEQIRDAMTTRKHELCRHGVPPMNCADHRPTPDPEPAPSGEEHAHG